MRIICFFTVVATFLSSCGLFTNISEPDNHTVNQNRDYILVNKTPYNNLTVYYSRLTQPDCGDYTQLVVMAINSTYAFHVNPGETVYIMYCTPDDVFCGGCRTLKLVGNSENQGNNVEL